jgi:hypothetical protein
MSISPDSDPYLRSWGHIQIALCRPGTRTPVIAARISKRPKAWLNFRPVDTAPAA